MCYQCYERDRRRLHELNKMNLSVDPAYFYRKTVTTTIPEEEGLSESSLSRAI